MYQWLELQPGEQVCDVGCGDGFWTQQLAGAGRRVVGIDVNPWAVMRARTYYGAAATFLVARGDELPLASDALDALTSVCALQHFADDMQGLREFARVLRPGGRLAMSVDSLSLPWIDDDYKALQARRYHVRHLYTHGSISAQLAAAGFNLRHYAYVGTSQVASALIQLQVERGWQVNYVAAVALPLSRFFDATTGWYNGGYSLAVLAEKMST